MRSGDLYFPFLAFNSVYVKRFEMVIVVVVLTTSTAVGACF